MWTRKHLLGIQELTKEEIAFVLEQARSFKEISTREVKKVPALRGKTIVNLFFEPSTRTRASFELAAKRLSADILNLSIAQSSVKKGETLLDTIHNIEAMNVDIVIIRHGSSGAPHFLSRKVNASIINAGDGWHEHPTQALLDMFTVKEVKGNIKGLNISIVGDIAHSRVARSDTWGFTKLGAKVKLCGPPTLIPKEIERIGTSVTYDIKDALKSADVVIVMRMQYERDDLIAFPSVREYREKFGIDRGKLESYAKDDVVIMHPGPINRGIELDQAVADGRYSVILNQVTNGVAVRMAVLYLISGVGESEVESSPSTTLRVKLGPE